MQFIYTKPEYREYRGHVFFGGKPVTILDGHTETLLRLNPDFKVVDVVESGHRHYTVEVVPVIVPRETTTGLHNREILTVKNKGGRPKKKVH